MAVTRDRQGRLLPTGECWCGCGADTGPGYFFAPGHDKRAESAVILTVYGSVAEFLFRHMFGPDGKKAVDELKRWRENGGQVR